MDIKWNMNRRELGQDERTDITAILSNGTIQSWNMHQEKIIHENDELMKNHCILYCSDQSIDGKKLFVAGADRKIYIYDIDIQAIESSLHGRNMDMPGH